MIRKLVLSGIGCVVLAGLCLVYAQENHKDAEAYIIESERQWAESVASGDSSVIERILADDFIGVGSRGKAIQQGPDGGGYKECSKVFCVEPSERS